MVRFKKLIKLLKLELRQELQFSADKKYVICTQNRCLKKKVQLKSLISRINDYSYIISTLVRISCKTDTVLMNQIQD